jgi:hypothetical protein
MSKTKKERKGLEACILISIGEYGGFYIHKGYLLRICLGWVAVSFIQMDGDKLLKLASERAEQIGRAVRMSEVIQKARAEREEPAIEQTAIDAVVASMNDAAANLAGLAKRHKEGGER